MPQRPPHPELTSRNSVCPVGRKLLIDDTEANFERLKKTVIIQEQISLKKKEQLNSPEIFFYRSASQHSGWSLALARVSKVQQRWQ